MLFKSAGFDGIADLDEKNGKITGYGSVFGNVDSDNDIINKGAYTKTIKENGSRVRYLYQHDMSKPLGTIDSLSEDNRGLKFEATIPPTTLGKDTLILMKNGVINQNSVGIIPIQKQFNNKGIREINEVKLFEISAVTMAANDQAMITDAKGNIDIDLVNKRFDALAKIIRKEQITDELGYAIEAELMKLKSLTSSITVPTEVTQPIDVKNDGDEIVKYLLKNLNTQQ